MTRELKQAPLQLEPLRPPGEPLTLQVERLRPQVEALTVEPLRPQVEALTLQVEASPLQVEPQRLQVEPQRLREAQTHRSQEESLLKTVGMSTSSESVRGLSSDTVLKVNSLNSTVAKGPTKGLASLASSSMMSGVMTAQPQ